MLTEEHLWLITERISDAVAHGALFGGSDGSYNWDSARVEYLRATGAWLESNDQCVSSQFKFGSSVALSPRHRMADPRVQPNLLPLTSMLEIATGFTRTTEVRPFLSVVFIVCWILLTSQRNRTGLLREGYRSLIIPTIALWPLAWEVSPLVWIPTALVAAARLLRRLPRITDASTKTKWQLLDLGLTCLCACSAWGSMLAWMNAFPTNLLVSVHSVASYLEQSAWAAPMAALAFYMALAYSGLRFWRGSRIALRRLGVLAQQISIEDVCAIFLSSLLSHILLSTEELPQISAWTSLAVLGSAGASQFMLRRFASHPHVVVIAQSPKPLRNRLAEVPQVERKPLLVIPSNAGAGNSPKQAVRGRLSTRGRFEDSTAAIANVRDSSPLRDMALAAASFQDTRLKSPTVHSKLMFDSLLRAATVIGGPSVSRDVSPERRALRTLHRNEHRSLKVPESGSGLPATDKILKTAAL